MSAILRKRLTSHCLGISPIHSIPLSFISTSEFNPFVTASVIRDCLYFLYSSIESVVSVIILSIFDTFSSRYSTIFCCSLGVGYGSITVLSFDIGILNLICLLYTSDAADEEDSVDLG